eukprot:CAMPEP_0197174634 /NCGR_PEP_ID=MMETSP1423-20130617/1061_1 /TAXON_ID=476441 /ORGANISM="Pseudo-nitzschia heimii, Strain UNC1101" /LENGTH=201 /DNA_ID=CAMNT_0042623577 /DNA_START=191 /DNA_END=797 /DNA_ORIENTATION=-
MRKTNAPGVASAGAVAVVVVVAAAAAAAAAGVGRAGWCCGVVAVTVAVVVVVAATTTTVAAKAAAAWVAFEAGNRSGRSSSSPASVVWRCGSLWRKAATAIAASFGGLPELEQKIPNGLDLSPPVRGVFRLLPPLPMLSKLLLVRLSEGSAFPGGVPDARFFVRRVARMGVDPYYRDPAIEADGPPSRRFGRCVVDVVVAY